MSPWHRGKRKCQCPRQYRQCSHTLGNSYWQCIKSAKTAQNEWLINLSRLYKILDTQLWEEKDWRGCPTSKKPITNSYYYSGGYSQKTPAILNFISIYPEWIKPISKLTTCANILNSRGNRSACTRYVTVRKWTSRVQGKAFGWLHHNSQER